MEDEAYQSLPDKYKSIQTEARLAAENARVELEAILKALKGEHPQIVGEDVLVTGYEIET